MPNTMRKVSYAYVTAASKPGEAARILQALRDANVNLLAFSGFPQGRNKAQIDVVTDDLDALKGVARGRKWRLSRIKRAFLVQGTDEAGAAVGPLARLGAANINVIAADAIAAGEGRFGMIFWVEVRSYNRAATLLGAACASKALPTQWPRPAARSARTLPRPRCCQRTRAVPATASDWTGC